MTDILGIHSPEWMSNPDRNCAIPDEFSPEEAGAIADQWFPTELGEIQYAKRLCGGCPAAARCLEYAMENAELIGIWGGTSTGQRIKARNKKKAAAKRAGNDAA